MRLDPIGISWFKWFRGRIQREAGIDSRRLGRCLELIEGPHLGHYLVALAQAYRQKVRFDPELSSASRTIDYIIGQLKMFQTAMPNGYLFASPETHFDVVEGKGKAISGTW